MTTYAEGTTVSESKSKIELDEMLRKWKCSNVAVGGSDHEAIAYFALNGWHVKFRMPMPTDAEAKKHAKRRGSYWDPTQAQKDAWIEQERRRRWRALVLTIKAKLVSVENAVESFESAFLAHLVLAGGATVADQVLPALEASKKESNGGPVFLRGLLGSGSDA